MEAKPLSDAVPPRVKAIERWMRRRGVARLRFRDELSELELELDLRNPPAPTRREPTKPKTAEEIAKDVVERRRRAYAIELGCRPEDITDEHLRGLP